jgi:hypothetical protein
MVSYYCPLKPGAFKTFSTPTDSFWCCVGTGMENHAKYNDSIYFHDAGSLYVNLFIPSELTWKQKGVKVRQLTKFPEDDSTSLTIDAASPVQLALKIRYPSWAQSGVTVAVNGSAQKTDATPGSFITIDRQWKTGDRLDVRLPMALHMEALPDDPHIQALLYGPVVLAGDLSTAGLDSVKRYGPSAPAVGRVTPIPIPAFVAPSSSEVLAHVERVQGQPLTFRTKGLGQPNDVTLIPLYKTFEPRYTVYWNVYNATEWTKHNADRAADAARHQDIVRRTVDVVDVSQDTSEQAHGYAGQGVNQGFVEGRRWRDARNGFLTYELKVQPDQPVTIVCTYRGSEGQRRAFDVLVDGEKVASEVLEYHPTELLDREYSLPERLTRGKRTITVTFQPAENARTGGVVEIRTVQASR